MQETPGGGAGNVTIYPSASYEIHNGDEKVSLSLGDILVATAGTTGTTTTLEHIHTDHLNGTNIITDSTGTVIHLKDYYPYGSNRINSGSANEKTDYTGYTKDVSTGLHYAGARYYDNSIGRFMSLDPANLRLGINEKSEFEKILTDPQLLNTYAYAGNNPVNNIDDNGELSLRGALSSPFAIPASLWLSVIAEYGGGEYNIPLSQELLQHSLTFEPEDQYVSQDSDFVKVIQGTETYKEGLDQILSDNEQIGVVDNIKLPLRFFRKDGDAYSSISRIDLYVTGNRNEDGNWDLSLQGRDTYDYGFNFSDYSVDKFGIGANVLYGAQQAGVLTPFDTHVNFKEKNYTPNKEQNNEN